MSAGIFFAIGCIFGYLFFKILLQTRKQKIDDLAATIIEKADEKAAIFLSKAEEKARQNAEEISQKLHIREELLQQKEKKCTQESKILTQKLHEVTKREEESAFKKKQIESQLTAIAQLTKEEARKYILSEVENQTHALCHQIIQERVRTAEKDAHNQALRLIQTVLGRIAAPTSANSSIELFHVPDDATKGKIIGREGRNKKIFEEITNVSLIIDASSNVITISSFDPEQRYIAKKALQELSTSKKIHKDSILQCVHKYQTSLDSECTLIGKNAALTLGLFNFSPEIWNVLGKLHFRLSCGQNVLAHSVEVASIMESLAAELHLDSQAAKRMGLLHDIGKALSLDYGTTHAIAGACFLRKQGEEERICRAVASHHNEISPESVEAALLQTADTISAARPGVRDQKKQMLFSRMYTLERLAKEEASVHEAHAIETGSDIHLVVQKKDSHAGDGLAEKLLYRIDKDIKLPHPVKVSIIDTPKK